MVSTMYLTQNQHNREYFQSSVANFMPGQFII